MAKTKRDQTYAIQGSPVLGRLHNLNRGIVPRAHRDIGRQRHAVEADAVVILGIGRALDVKHGHHDEAVVGGQRPQPEVDVHERLGVAGLEAHLEGEDTAAAAAAAVDGPRGPVLAHGQAAAWVLPLHAVGIDGIAGTVGEADGQAVGFGYCAIGDEVVAARAWIADVKMGLDDCCKNQDRQEM